MVRSISFGRRYVNITQEIGGPFLPIVFPYIPRFHEKMQAVERFVLLSSYPHLNLNGQIELYFGFLSIVQQSSS